MPNSRFLMARTGLEDGYQGQASDIALAVKEVRPSVRPSHAANIAIRGCCDTIVLLCWRRLVTYMYMYVVTFTVM